MLGEDLGVSRLLGLLLVVALGLTSCSGDDPGTGTTPSAAPTTAPPTAAPPPPEPKRLECRRLTFDEALAPTDSDRIVGCRTPHTGQTYAVGQLRTVVDGHLVAVDSARVQEQVAQTCPRKLAAFLGTTDEVLRLSMLRAVWFTPSLEQSDAGANWYRCDVVAVAGDDRLARVRGSLEQALADAGAVDAYGMCGTAAPDDPAFERVLCREDHAWRAIQVVDLPGRDYPGEKRARAAGQATCEDAGREVAEDALDYEWGYEWPTAEQWAAGQTYGRCWAPDTATTDEA
ncbi:MAG: septum formation family protein [Nocardioides sp.]|nr:septum formation family protein [Nocardioides sp.]